MGETFSTIEECDISNNFWQQYISKDTKPIIEKRVSKLTETDKKIDVTN